MSKFYVTMTDKFLSGWGLAKGKIAKLVIECDTKAQALTIESNAKDRPEMRRVSVRTTEPSYGSGYVVDWKTYADMSGSWVKGA